jgi:mannose/fructose/N-acetylgalactosamine-specific phosphotransferase system component IIB
VIDEISFVGVECLMSNNRLRFIKHIQNKFFGDVDVIMISDFYQAPPMKYSWIFQNIKNNVNALTSNFWQTYVQCYEQNKVMQQFDMVLIQTLNKFCTAIENTKDIEFINSI